MNALRLWHDFGAKDRIPRAEDPKSIATTNNNIIPSPFRTLYSEDFDTIVKDLRSGAMTGSSAADRIELLQSRVNKKLIGRRPIPNTLPSNKGVYLGIVALSALGSAPTAVTVSDSLIMDLAAPVDSIDLILISKSRVSQPAQSQVQLNHVHNNLLNDHSFMQLIAALRSLGLVFPDEPAPIDGIISLLWKEARPVEELSLQTEHTNRDIEATSTACQNDDLIELGMLKLALFGVSLNQPSWFAKYCLPCGNPKPTYCETSWVSKSKMKRATGELVKHDAEKCAVCRNGSNDECPSDSVYI